MNRRPRAYEGNKLEIVPGAPKTDSGTEILKQRYEEGLMKVFAAILVKGQAPGTADPLHQVPLLKTRVLSLLPASARGKDATEAASQLVPGIEFFFEQPIGPRDVRTEGAFAILADIFSQAEGDPASAMREAIEKTGRTLVRITIPAHMGTEGRQQEFVFNAKTA